MIPALVSCIVAFILLSFMETSHPLLVGPFSKLDTVDYTFGGALYSGAIDVFFLSGRSVYNPVLWTMKIELIGSFIVYLLCVNSATFRARVLPLLVLLIIAVLVATKSVEHRLGLGLMCFIGGYLFKIYGVYVSSTKSIILLLIGLYLAGAHNDSFSYGFINVFLGTYTYSLCNFLSGFMIVYAVIFGIKINHIFSLPLPVFMGKVSYSVYLIHFPIISTLGVYLFGVLYEFFSSYVISVILTSFITIIFTYGCSILFYKYVDLKGMAMSNAMSKAIIDKISMVKRRARQAPG